MLSNASSAGCLWLREDCLGCTTRSTRGESLDAGHSGDIEDLINAPLPLET
jgi:hypothetical protein